MDKEGRVRAHLVQFGLSEPMARCLAKPLARDLSVAQLRQLGGLAKAVRDRREPHGTTALIEQLTRTGDPQIVAVAGKAALGCALLR